MLKYIILFFSFSTAFSQTINLRINDNQGTPISLCNVLFKEKTTNNILEYSKVYDGRVIYTIKKNYTAIVIEIQSTSYFSETLEIESPIKNKTYFFDVVLKQNTVKQLEEVIVKSPDRPYQIKKDTVVFDVNKYRDGSEKKVEDLIKKLK